MVKEQRKVMDESADAYDYDLRVEEELRARRKIRKELAVHRRAINRCNVLLLFETVVFVFLIVALIIIW